MARKVAKKKKTTKSKKKTNQGKKYTPRGKMRKVSPGHIKFISSLIQKHMRKRGIDSRAEFCKESGMSAGRVNNLLSLRAKTLSDLDIGKLTDALGVSKARLLGFQEPAPEPAPAQEEVIDLTHLAVEDSQEDEEGDPVALHVQIGRISIRIDVRL